jgi:hypothetical protein
MQRMRMRQIAGPAVRTLVATLALALGGAATAVDSPNTVVDPGFEGSSTAWKREFFRAPGGTNQCGTPSARVVAGDRAGFATLEPIYLSTTSGANSCSSTLPCPEPDGIGYTLGMVSLFQRDIEVPEGQYFELSFDYRLRSALGSIGCVENCFTTFDALKVSAFGSDISDQVLVISHDGSPSSGWRRARIGGLRGTSAPSVAEVRFTLLASVIAEAGYAYGAFADIDNVRVTTFNLACESSWSCPEVAAGSCPAAALPTYFTNEAFVAAASASADAEATFACERPCFCQGDVNQDGVVSGGDLGAVLGAWGTSWPPADIDGDGVVGGADIGVVLGNWGCTN